MRNQLNLGFQLIGQFVFSGRKLMFPGFTSGSLHLRSDLHLARKFWHSLCGFGIALVYGSGVSQGVLLATFGSLLLLDAVFEWLRLKSPALNMVLIKFWGPIMREREVNQWSGMFYYLISTVVLIAFFPRVVAILSILYLALGDPVASLFGILYGDTAKRFSNGKSIIGVFAGVFTCILATAVLLSSVIVGFKLWIICIGGGLIGGAAELLPIDVDDNVLIPIVSAGGLWIIFTSLGLL